MNLLPPVGWADVATKQDLAHLEQHLEGRLDKLEGRFDKLEGRFDKLDGRLDTRIDGLQSSFVGWLLASQAMVVAIIGAATAAIIAVLG